MTGQSSKAAIVLCVCSFYNVQYLYICFFVRLEATSFEIVILFWKYTYIACKKRKIMFEFTEAIFVKVISFSFINTFYRFPLLSLSFTKSGNFHIQPLFVYFPFLREKDCNWCFHEYLPVSDSSEVRWKPAYQWGRRDYKVKTSVQVKFKKCKIFGLLFIL